MNWDEILPEFRKLNLPPCDKMFLSRARKLQKQIDKLADEVMAHTKGFLDEAGRYIPSSTRSKELERTREFAKIGKNLCEISEQLSGEIASILD